MAGSNDRADSIGWLRDGKIHENHDYWNMATLIERRTASSP